MATPNPWILEIYLFMGYPPLLNFKKFPNFKNSVRIFFINSSLPDKQILACNKLLTLIDIINETVGDALSDMLLVETILHDKGWNIQQWESCYTDLPNKLLKVTIKVGNMLN